MTVKDVRNWDSWPIHSNILRVGTLVLLPVLSDDHVPELDFHIEPRTIIFGWQCCHWVQASFLLSISRMYGWVIILCMAAPEPWIFGLLSTPPGSCIVYCIWKTLYLAADRSACRRWRRGPGRHMEVGVSAQCFQGAAASIHLRTICSALVLLTVLS